MRFRKEKGFYLVNIQWANTIEVNNEIAEFLIKFQRTKKPFTLKEFGKEKKNVLMKLFIKRVVESDEVHNVDVEEFCGLSLDPSKVL